MKRSLVLLAILVLYAPRALVAQNKFSMHVYVSYSAHFVVKDPLGRRTGIDPRGGIIPELGTRYREIPRANYATETPGDNPDEVLDEVARKEISRVFACAFESPASEGSFEITLFGIGLDNVDVLIEIGPSNESSQLQSCRFELKELIDSSVVKKFLMTYHGQPGTEIKLEKEMDVGWLRSDLNSLFKLGWIQGQPVYSKYSNLVSACEVAMQRKDFWSARSALASIIKNISQDSSYALSAVACRFFRSDVETIIAMLPPGLVSLSPASANLGSNSFTLIVKGVSFVSGSIVQWNRSPRPTSFVSDSVLQASILATDIATAGLASVAVVNPGNDTSNVLPFTITQPPTGLNVKLINSTGTNLTGGSLQYYDGSWKDATNNNDGTFSITTSLKTLSLRMTYEFATQTKSNVTVGYDTVAFQTVNTQVKLQSSQGVPIDTGTVQYYFSAWKPFGTTTNGIASKELLPGSYTFRMTYASATNDKQQDIGTNPVVLFQTVNASVQLKNSQGALMDQGTVQYYFSSWNNLGNTANGIATKELLPGNYTFRMTYAAATNDKLQNIGTNPTVIFQTVNTTVQLQNSLGSPIDQGTVQYYFSSWNNLGATTNGVPAKELLPGSYTFRMTYEFATNEKQQNIGTNPAVVFQTVNAMVQLRNSQGAPIDTGRVQYYFSAWKELGVTSNGVAVKELLPANYTFRMTHESVTNEKAQNISTNNTVAFSTVLCTVRVKNSQNQPVNGALASYYFSAWRQIGPTANGEITKELLPANLTFRITLGTVSQDKAQNIATSSLVEFVTQ